MANITRIKAKDAPKEKPEGEPEPKAEPKKTPDTESKAKKASKEKPAKSQPKNPGKKPFILIRPFVYFFRYLRDSWHEIRQVRWPSRKATWKLFFAIIIYTLLIGAIIMLLDVFFTWLFNLIIG